MPGIDFCLSKIGNESLSFSDLITLLKENKILANRYLFKNQCLDVNTLLWHEI